MQDDDNAHYFRTSREKSSGRPHAEIAGDRTENLRELKESLGLIHTALKRSGGWVLGSHRKSFLLSFSLSQSLVPRWVGFLCCLCECFGLVFAFCFVFCLLWN